MQAKTGKEVGEKEGRSRKAREKQMLEDCQQRVMGRKMGE